jgi:hypothetical protein
VAKPDARRPPKPDDAASSAHAFAAELAGRVATLALAGDLDGARVASDALARLLSGPGAEVDLESARRRGA